MYRQAAVPTTVFAILLATVLAIGVLIPGPVLAGVPPTPTEPVVETLHGVEIVDPYRWLEGSDAPEIGGEGSEIDQRTAAWTDAQNAYTRQVLDVLPGREAFEARLRELDEVGSISAPEVAGGRYFYRERRGDENQSVLYVRQGHDGEPRKLLDPNAIDPSGLTTLAWSEPSPDGELLAFGMYSGGDENSTLYLLRVKDGFWLAEEIPGKVGGVFWRPDGSGFFYRRLEDVDNPYSAQIKYHRVGEHHRQDPLLFEQYKTGSLATTWGPRAFSNEEARWVVLTYATGTDSNDLWVYDADAWLETGELRRIDIILGEKASSRATVIGDRLYLLTTLDAPNGRVVMVDLEKPGREHWREIVPERDKAVLRGLSRAGNFLVASYLDDASTKIELFDFEGRLHGPLALPGLGSAFLSTEPGSHEAFLSFQSFAEPTSIYRVDLGTGERELWARPEVPIDPSRFTVEQIFYRSEDGTRVPMFLVYAGALGRDGKNPTILSGYGGFNIPRTPRFSSQMIPWLEAGGVYAVANLRGGGEYGEAWHRAGMLGEKQNVFDDFLAAAEWLVASRWTSPDHLGIAGGSNGGLLTGAAVVQRPELFSAVYCAVPLLDMLRYQYFLMARFWVPEYGSAENAEQFAFLREYSPYHHVEKGTKYPAVLLTAGENDTRVHPLHARKMAARMQAATASEPATEPILLWVERDAGHGAGKPLELRHRDTVDYLSFMAWQLGMAPTESPKVEAAEAPVGGSP